MSNYEQLILFGGPGTGKSYSVANSLLKQLGVGEHYVRTVFHPEYSYGDFMGKLMPLTRGDSVTYEFYPGHFLRALAMAYDSLLRCAEDEEPQHVALIIDEINRGNSAGIFGTAFQLLDRGRDGWSEYPVNLSDLEFDALLEEVGIEPGTKERRGRKPQTFYYYDSDEYTKGQLESILDEKLNISFGKVRVPPNLSLLATMNTSDNSIYYMDSAFKRRWEWQFVDINGDHVRDEGTAFENREEWESFVDALNAFIKDHHKYIRQVEDKQVGYWFIDSDEILKSQIQNKVMFFLWDSVFGTHREPLAELMDANQSDMVTFGDFARRVDDFIRSVRNEYGVSSQSVNV